MKRSFALIFSLAAALPFAHVAAARTPDTTLQAPLVRRCTEATARILDWAAYMAIEAQFYRARRPVDIVRQRSKGAPERADPAAASPATASSAPGHTTTTNVQEAGVDEADLVKTDGKYIYTVVGREVVIVRSWPAARARVVARYQLPGNATPQSLFLDDDRLVVLSHVFDEPVARPNAASVAGPHGPGFYGTRVSVLDISERPRPRPVHEADIEGAMAEARMIGDDVYVVSNAPMYIPAPILEAAEWRARRLGTARGELERGQFDKPRAFRAVRAHLEEKFGRTSAAATLPRQRHVRPGGGMSAFRPLYACTDLFVPDGGGQLGTLNVVHFDVDAPEQMDAVGILASGWQVYASTGALYAAMPNYGWYHIWGWGPEPRAADFNVTNIHKFDLRGDGNRPVYAASGRVRGHILNQFSMSEHDGYLRVATTDQTWGGGQGGNHLQVLAERGRRLAVVGAIEDLARGERIFSARMMGDKGYLVTFRQTDPLFTLDLSDPRRPRVAGELKINGFSSYIHPLDGDHLLTIGQDATDEGRVRGAHVQIFDVSDPDRPRRTAHRLLTDDSGSSWSAAQWDHHAFTYDPRTRVLAVPVSAWSAEPFHGLVLLQVGGDSLREIGRIDHLRLAQKAGLTACGGTGATAAPCATPVVQDGRAQIVRSIVMDDVILSLSHLGLQANVLAHPERTLARVLFASDAAIIAE